MADQHTARPGFSDQANNGSINTRNRRRNRFDLANGGANRTGSRHRRYESDSIGFTAAGNEITDSNSAFVTQGFTVGERLKVDGSASNNVDDTGAISAVVAGQIDTDEFPFGVEAAGADVRLGVRHNRNTRRFDGFP